MYLRHFYHWRYILKSRRGHKCIFYLVTIFSANNNLLLECPKVKFKVTECFCKKLYTEIWNWWRSVAKTFQGNFCLFFEQQRHLSRFFLSQWIDPVSCTKLKGFLLKFTFFFYTRTSFVSFLVFNRKWTIPCIKTTRVSKRQSSERSGDETCRRRLWLHVPLQQFRTGFNSAAIRQKDFTNYFVSTIWSFNSESSSWVEAENPQVSAENSFGFLAFTLHIDGDAPQSSFEICFCSQGFWVDWLNWPFILILQLAACCLFCLINFSVLCNSSSWH